MSYDEACCFQDSQVLKKLATFPGAKSVESFQNFKCGMSCEDSCKKRSEKQMDAEQKTLATENELDKAVAEARQHGEMTARIEVGEWIEANMLNGPKENPYSSFFPVLAERLKQGKRL